MDTWGENFKCWGPEERAAWRDEEADVNDSRAGAPAYHAPEPPPNEDWRLRDECLKGPGSYTFAKRHFSPFGSPFFEASSMPSLTSIPGIGGAPTRATTLPCGPAERKAYPVATGVLDYFPDAIVAIARLSAYGNEQHNPNSPLHWDRSKSGDEADTLIRHFLQRGTLDTDGIGHTVKVAWRALAMLQKEIEQEAK